jgi:hypothetical protein
VEVSLSAASGVNTGWSKIATAASNMSPLMMTSEEPDQADAAYV